MPRLSELLYNSECSTSPTRGSENNFEACSLSQAVSIAAGEMVYLWRGAIIRPLLCRLWRIVHGAAYSMQLLSNSLGMSSTAQRSSGVRSPQPLLGTCSRSHVTCRAVLKPLWTCINDGTSLHGSSDVLISNQTYCRRLRRDLAVL